MLHNLSYAWIRNTIRPRYCHVFGLVTVDGIWIGLDLLTPLLTTSNDSATANLHNSHFTTAHAKRFPASCVFTCRSLATVSNSRDSPTIPSTGLGSSLYSFGTYPTENTVSNNSSIVACIYVAAGTCVPSRRLLVDVSSGSTIPNFRRHFTIFFISWVSGTQIKQLSMRQMLPPSIQCFNSIFVCLILLLFLYFLFLETIEKSCFTWRESLCCHGPRISLCSP
jgi:hypothetical protein